MVTASTIFKTVKLNSICANVSTDSLPKKSFKVAALRVKVLTKNSNISGDPDLSSELSSHDSSLSYNINQA